MMIVFFFNDTATTEIYTLSLHDALPICIRTDLGGLYFNAIVAVAVTGVWWATGYHALLLVVATQILQMVRSEEHTSELQSRQYLVCRLLLEKKKTLFKDNYTSTSSTYLP